MISNYLHDRAVVQMSDETFTFQCRLPDGVRFPHEVVLHSSLTHPQKRALLAMWASDASAVTSFPTLRTFPGTDFPVLYSSVMDALEQLDRTEGIETAVLAELRDAAATTMRAQARAMPRSLGVCALCDANATTLEVLVGGRVRGLCYTHKPRAERLPPTTALATGFTKRARDERIKCRDEEAHPDRDHIAPPNRAASPL